MVDQDGHWSDTQATAETDETSAHGEHRTPVEQVAVQDEQDLTITPPKVSSDDDKRPLSPASGVGIDAPASTEQPEDARSVQSLPVVRVTEHSDIPPSAQDTPASMDVQRPPAAPRPPRTPASPNDPRSARRASTFPENRAGNRFSGFFTNLIHRRDALPATPSSSIQNEDRPISPIPSPRDIALAPNTPMPTVPPPPAFPSPTLQELGLNISTVTPSLSPSHFTSPPCSGTFLSPHYLLLCHAQGLDVIPLVAPPAPMSYALVRRVPFKSVVVMEQRGVLVAIAGRRDGVRVYALDEVRRAIDWRIETEVRREKDKTRREEAKKLAAADLGLGFVEVKDYPEKSSSLTPTTPIRTKSQRRPSTSSGVFPKRPPSPMSPVPPIPPLPSVDEPPTYQLAQTRDRIERRMSAHQLVQRTPTEPTILSPVATTRTQDDIKGEWSSRASSDDEAIDIVAAGASGSQALDERTSSIGATSSDQPSILPSSTIPPPSRSTNRRSRPANLDLSATRVESGSSTAVQPPSPTPTLTAIRQTLRSHPSTIGQAAISGNATPEPDGDEGDDEGPSTQADHITLVQALLESRIPGLPPAGTRQPQQAILIDTRQYVDESSRPRTSESTSQRSGRSNATRNRRRWSVMDVFHENTEDTGSAAPSPPTTPSSRPRTLSRSQPRRPSTNPSIRSESPANQPPVPTRSTPNLVQSQPTTPSRSRFLPRILSEAFSGRRGSTQSSLSDVEKSKVTATPSPAHAPPPKLEYVKLPGTKGAILIKAVETAKKSFLAILCGERGEKVELFAGTYRTALGLSRTFILPDSPKSLELQLQGDDLVEVFLVFSQNVFGLEPATVRVREVRIGRAERRAARRRARDREPLIEDILDTDPQDPGRDADATVSVNVSVSPPSRAGTPVTNDVSDQTHTQENEVTTVTVPQPSEELAVLAAAQASPYTTFQQLSFAPNFPLASISDEFIIPPTYQEFLRYRAEHEPGPLGENDVDLSQIQFSPPGLPVPVTLPPSKWYYRDPKGVVHGPWKTQLMQAWYKDGLLPPDLPVRREGDEEYLLLRELRLQCIDPSHPFGPSTPITVSSPSVPVEDGRPLLRPISLLAQPAHYGPPALFFSSRGGHSTTIVDARGRLVLKGRFLWSNDEDDDLAFSNSPGRLGDVKRIEAIDIQDRSVLVALRRGGLEAIDLCDALLKPADCSRMLLPHFDPPPSSVNRRGAFVWKMGTPLKPGPSTPVISALKGPSSRKKSGMGPTKSPNRTDFYLDPDNETHPEEIMFLGRKGNNLYVCERNSSSFRILHICPTAS